MLTLERWTPLRELDRMDRHLRRLLEERGLFEVEEPATDLYETDAEFVVELEVPGFEQSELAVELSDHTLVVKGEHREDPAKTERRLLVHERLERKFERRFELPREVDTDHISAGCDKGVLTLHVPKAGPAPKPRTIEIAKT